LTHEPALDGLRGLAVAGVLVFHGGYLQGGYLGVDAFFVLSGFLITSLLLVEATGSGGVSLRRFWARRARRLMPALACVLGFVAIYAWVWAKPEELSTIRGDAIATLLYVANWRQIFTSNDYFALFRSPSPLQHTWSLAIEEQFYVLWPLIVFGLVRMRRGFSSARTVLITCSSLAVVSVVWAQVLFHISDTARVYYGTDTRAAAILFGGALAAWLVWRGPVQGRVSRRVLEVLGVVAFVGVGIAWVSLPGTSPVLYEGGLVLCGIGVAVVIAAAVHPDRGVVFRVLSLKPLCWLGLISYGVYLWHWPLFVVLNPDRVHLTGGWLFLVRIAVTLAIAIASYFLIERPIRYGAGHPIAMLAAVPVIATILVVAIIGSTASVPTDAIAGGPSRGGVMVVGNSVARSLIPGLQHAGLGVTNRTIPGCSLVPSIESNATAPSCGPFRKWTRELRPSYVLLVTGLFEASNVRLPSGIVVTPDRDAFVRYFEGRLQSAIDALSSTGATVLIPSVPCMAALDGWRKVFPTKASRDESVFNPTRLRLENDMIRAVVRRPENVERVRSPDLERLLCPHGVFEQMLGAITPARPDGVHPSPAAGDEIARWLIRATPGLAHATIRGQLNTADRIERELATVGLSCVRATPDPRDRDLQDVMRCRRSLLDPREATLHVYSSSASLRRWVSAYRSSFCAAGAATVTYLVGDGWALTGTDPAVATAGGLLHGTKVKARC
jgi:peptidoglycan/LPS O-acetylase OafA/YrhL